LGADAYIYGTPKDVQQIHAEGEDAGTIKPFLARVDGRRPPARGETVRLVPKAGHVHLFNSESGIRLGK
jgi:multiple sugar transport system ATP-binding protein